jgi:hypothetical protein
MKRGCMDTKFANFACPKSQPNYLKHFIKFSNLGFRKS